MLFSNFVRSKKTKKRERRRAGSVKQESTGIVELSRVIGDRAPGKFGWWRVLLSITASGSCLSHRISRFGKICELADSSCYLRWNRIRDSVFDIGYHKWISCRSARPCCDPPRKVSSVLEPCKCVVLAWPRSPRFFKTTSSPSKLYLFILFIYRKD